MIHYLQYTVFIGAIVQLIGVVSYIKETIQGKTKPNKITWLLWSIAPLIATFAALSDGVKLSVLPVFVSGLGNLLVLLASFINKKSYWKLEKRDYFCGVLSVLALILWGITKIPSIAIVFAILSDGLATAPTLIKAWRHSETETLNSYTAGIFNALTSFMAIASWNFSSLAFPIYLLLVNIALVFAITHRKIIKKL